MPDTPSSQMENHTVLDLKVFVPARDYAVSRRFYSDLGFAEKWHNDQVAEFEAGNFRFLLQNYHAEGVAEHFMMHLHVQDADAWWKRISDAQLKERYQLHTAKPPALQPWGLRVLFISDPTGVLWHIAESPQLTVPPHLRPFWSDFAKLMSGAVDERFYEAFFFGDNEKLANELAELVLRGVKRATAESMWAYEDKGKRLPKPGDLSIVTNWAGQPLCVIETQSVEVVAFREVTADFAATEGEGDGSLSYWQEEHRRFFTRDCARAGRQFAEDMPVSCERFRVVYQPKA